MASSYALAAIAATLVAVVLTDIVSASHNNTSVGCEGAPWWAAVVNSKGKWEVVPTTRTSMSAPAKACFNDQIERDGWSYLSVKSNNRFSDMDQSYAAGFVEGVLTAERIYQAWLNTRPDRGLSKNVQRFIDMNDLWMENEILLHGDDDPYWYTIKLILRQVAGIADGYRSVGTQPSLTLKDFLLMNLNGDLEDLGSAGPVGEIFTKEEEKQTFFRRRKHVIGSGRCSSLVKLTEDRSELFAAQVTWTSYQQMIRIYKSYQLKVHTSGRRSDVIPGHTAVFSSYPGSVFSGDDFYQLSSGLVSMETTIGNNNATLNKYILPDTVLEWLRNVVANRLAASGEGWTRIFSLYNSGTYNNAWLVIDYKIFVPGSAHQKEGLFWYLEQLPNVTERHDLTAHLNDFSYFASYNVPFYKNIFRLSGSQANVDKYGSWFTYDATPRANIFRRDQTSVHTLKDMQRIMRYNKFQEDPLSRCACEPPYSAENAISARSDLNPADGVYPFGSLGHRLHGGTDGKITSYALMRDGAVSAVSGPTHDDQPVFKWSTAGDFANLTHVGHPDAFDFDWVRIKFDD